MYLIKSCAVSFFVYNVEAATIDVFEAKEQSARKRIKFHVDDTAGQSDSEGTLTYIKSVMSE